jgi:hypothetical protein
VRGSFEGGMKVMVELTLELVYEYISSEWWNMRGTSEVVQVPYSAIQKAGTIHKLIVIHADV